MSEANARQVGGKHYKREGIQHWDLMAMANAGYFAGQVTKYSERHSRKNGREDLEKALHFAEKMREVMAPKRPSGLTFWWIRRPRPRPPAVSDDVLVAIRKYALDAGLSALQERIFEYCLSRPWDGDNIVLLCRMHLDRCYPEPTTGPQEPEIREVWTPTRSGTPEDGGHHAQPDPQIDLDFERLVEESMAETVISDSAPVQTPAGVEVSLPINRARRPFKIATSGDGNQP